MNINRMFDKRFRGCPLLATMEDEARERKVKIFYIEQPTLVGVWDGVDTWISAVKGCFRNLPVGLLEKQIALAAEGKIASETVQRKKYGEGLKEFSVATVIKKVFQKRTPTHAN